MPRTTYAEAERAVRIAADISKLPLCIDSHGSMGDRVHSYSIADARTHNRFTPIGGLTEVYDYAHIIVRIAERMQGFGA